MSCEYPKEAWEKIKEDFEGNHQTKLMQILNLKREFKIIKIKVVKTSRSTGVG